MSTLSHKVSHRLSLANQRWSNNRSIIRLVRQVNASSSLYRGTRESPDSIAMKPVAFFNSSTRLTGMSLNAAFSLLASLGLQMAGVPVVRFACKAGMSRCVLGTDRDDPHKDPPCKACIAQSRWLYSDALVFPFSYQSDQALTAALDALSLEQLSGFEHQLPRISGQDAPGSKLSPLPLGKLVLPSIRWVLRRHHLLDDDPTRFLYRQYVLSAYHVALEFSSFLDKTNPQAVVLFNGQFFPEATARWVSLQQDIPAITHEVGLQPFSAFFTSGEATAYPLHVPDDFILTAEQDQRLDGYLSQRFQGQFSMAGIQFWPAMKGLGEDFSRRVGAFKQVVPVFTNVIFDTSQPHSNVVFPHMFSWLDQVLEIARSHPQTFFVLRAHPDEARPGKESRQSVSQWVEQNHADDLPNLIFIDADQALSSYELIRSSKFVMVYNSTIGLEASILGVPVLCAGRARYTQLPTVFFPATPEAYVKLAENFLIAPEISVPPEFKLNARRFLYYQLFRSSLPFSEFLEPDGIWPGFVRLKKFLPQALAPSSSPAIKAIYRGLIEHGDFLLDHDL